MSDSNQSLPNMIGGVSQQSAAERLPNTFEDLENTYASLVDGMTRRPGTDFLAEMELLGGDTVPFESDEMTLHAIDRSVDERYLVVHAPTGPNNVLSNNGLSNLRIFDTDGTPVHFVEPGANNAAYLDHRTDQVFPIRRAEAVDQFAIGGTPGDAVAGQDKTTVDGPVGFGKAVLLESTNGDAAWRVNGLGLFQTSTDNKTGAIFFRDDPTLTSPDTFTLALFTNATGDIVTVNLAKDAAGLWEITSTTSSASIVVASKLELLANGYNRVAVSANLEDPGTPAVDHEIEEFRLSTTFAAGGGCGILVFGAFLTDENGFTVENLKPYLRSTFSEAFKFKTVGDTTFVLNTGIVPEMGVSLTPTQVDLRTVWIRGYAEQNTGIVLTVQTGTVGGAADAEQRYEVWMDSTANTAILTVDPFASTETQIVTNALVAASGTNPTQPAHSYIAVQNNPLTSAFGLFYQMDTDIDTADGGNVANWKANGGGAGIGATTALARVDIELHDNIITLSPRSGFEILKFEVTSTSKTFKQIHVHPNTPGQSGYDLDLFTGSAESEVEDTQVVAFGVKKTEVTGLPIVFRNGRKVEIFGTKTTTADDYWAEFETFTGEDFGEGFWFETVAPEIPFEFFAAKMPHQLVRGQDDELGAITGTPNRVFFSLQEVPWSDREVGDELINKDPSFIGTKIKDLDFHQGRMLFLSGQNVILSRSQDIFDFWRSTTQGIPIADRVDATLEHNKAVDLLWARPLDDRLLVGGRNVQFSITSDGPLSTTSIKSTPILEQDLYLVEPTILGFSLFAAGPAGDFTEILEIFPADQRSRYQAIAATLAVPRYLDKLIVDTAVSDSERLLIFLGSSGEAFLYKVDPGNPRLGGWFKWTFGDRIAAAEFIENTMYAVVDRGGTFFLERLQLPVDSSRVFLDMQTTDFTTAFAAGDTVITLPYTVAGHADMLVVVDGIQVAVTSSTTTTLTVQGDQTANVIQVGFPFTTKIEMSRPFFVAPGTTGGLGTTIEEDVMVQALNLLVEDTQAFTIDVTTGDQSYSTQYLLPPIGIFLIGTPIPSDSRITHPIGGINLDTTVTIKTALPYHLRIQVLEWQLLQNTRRAWKPL